MARILSTLIALVLVTGIMTGALAHSKMARSEPPDGGTANVGIAHLSVAFDKPVRVVRVTVERTDESEDIPVLKKDAAAFSKIYGVTVPPLAAGVYRVNWTAVAKDGHVMKGDLSFTVTP